MDLIIVESPTKAKTLGRFLGKDYSVEATMGHVKDLPKSKLGVDVDKNYKPDYILVDARSKELNKIKGLAKKAKIIYLATDPDREGEAIAAHVKEEIGNGKTKRIVFHEITETAVNHALSEPRGVDENLVNAQIARRVLDRLVGYKLSPLLWRKVRRGLSAGRVQSVAVRLIVEREAEIKAFKAEEYWEIFCDVQKSLPAGRQDTFRIKLLKEKVGNQKESDVIVNNLKNASYQVSDVVKRERHKKPFAPFTTSTMSQAAANLYGWSAKKTMSVAQKLYEEGLITYHRTDSLNIAVSAQAAALKYISDKYGPEYVPVKPNFYKTNSKSAQEAHEAIRPTTPADNGTELVKEQAKLYDLIRNRFLASQMTPSVYDETKIDVAADKYLLRATGQTQKFAGWKIVYNYKAPTDEVILPKVTVGDALNLLSVDPQQKFTQPPARFNEASLIKTLEKLGIGRPSTYAPTIHTIQIRKYIEKEDKKFFPTHIGEAVNSFLMANFSDVFEYQFTADMENDLDNIAKGTAGWEKIIDAFYKPFNKKLESVGESAKRVKIETEKLGRKCPECKEGELVIRIGRFGKFISCERFPDCKHTEKYLDKIDMKCPDCKDGDVIVKKTGKGRPFFGCSRYPECKYASWKNPKLNKDGDETEDQEN